MSTHPIARPIRSMDWLALGAPVPVGLVAALFGHERGIAWRQLLALAPHDPAPAAGMLVVVAIASLSVLAGLWLLLSIRRPIGAIPFALGAGLICGVAIGFVSG